MRLHECVNLYFMQSIAQVVIFFNFTSKQFVKNRMYKVLSII